jgi:hypothetical protein
MIDDILTSVEVCKKNVYADEVPGAQLTLTGTAPDGTPIDFYVNNVDLGRDAVLVSQTDGQSLTWISGSTSTYVKDLPNGTYFIEEIAAPSGYEVTTIIEFTIQDGVVTGSTGISDRTVTVTDDFTLTDIAISKASVLGGEVPGAQLTLTGTDLTGRPVVFDIDKVVMGTDGQLISTENSSSLTWISGSDSTFVRDLPDGTYTLHEDAAPAGYDVTTDIVFQIIRGVITGDVGVDSSASKVTITDDVLTTTTTSTATTTTTVTTTTTGTSSETSSAGSTTTTKGAAGTTTTAASTTTKPAAAADSPRTGVATVAVPFAALALAAATAFVSRKRREDE